MGYDCLHVAIDDATRLAYVEVLPDEKRQSTTGFLVRALRGFRARGVKVERVMTDNYSGYVAKLFRKALRILGIRHTRDLTRGKPMAKPSASSRPCCREIPFKSSYSRPPTSTDGSRGTTAHQNTHLSMLLKGRGFAGRDLVPRGIWRFGALVRRSSWPLQSRARRERRSKVHPAKAGRP